MLNAKDYRQQARNALNGNRGTMAVIALLYILFSAALAYTFIGTLLLSGVLSIGLASVTLSLLRTGNTKAEFLFDGFKGNLTNALTASVLYTVYLVLWSLLFLVPGIVKTYSYSMTFYILRDEPDMSAQNAITRSRQMMDGNKLRLFCLHLSFIGWILLSILTFGILLIFVLPYMQTAQAAFYEDLKRAQMQDTAPRDYFGEEPSRDYFGEKNQ